MTPKDPTVPPASVVRRFLRRHGITVEVGFHACRFVSLIQRGYSAEQARGVLRMNKNNRMPERLAPVLPAIRAGEFARFWRGEPEGPPEFPAAGAAPSALALETAAAVEWLATVRTQGNPPGAEAEARADLARLLERLIDERMAVAGRLSR